MKALLTLACALSVVAVDAGRAQACPCSDDAGSAAGLVRKDERFAAAIVATSRRALGRFDALGRYSPLSADEREASEELLLRAGLRLPERLEWLGELGYSDYRLHAPRWHERQTGVGDALFHTRYRVLDEAMPHASLPLPAATLSVLVRAPLGALAGQQRSFGSGGAQRGLGAWELGGGFELFRSIEPWLDLSLTGEAAYRFEDHVLGAARRLGPRLEAALAARVLTKAWLSGSLALRVRATSDVTFEGRRLDGTSERLWSVVAGLAAFEPRSHFRSSLTFSLDPPIRGLSRGSTAAMALGVSLGLATR